MLVNWNDPDLDLTTHPAWCDTCDTIHTDDDRCRNCDCVACTRLAGYCLRCAEWNVGEIGSELIGASVTEIDAAIFTLASYSPAAADELLTLLDDEGVLPAPTWDGRPIVAIHSIGDQPFAGRTATDLYADNNA